MLACLARTLNEKIFLFDEKIIRNKSDTERVRGRWSAAAESERDKKLMKRNIWYNTHYDKQFWQMYSVDDGKLHVSDYTLCNIKPDDCLTGWLVGIHSDSLLSLSICSFFSLCLDTDERQTRPSGSKEWTRTMEKLCASFSINFYEIKSATRERHVRAFV